MFHSRVNRILFAFLLICLCFLPLAGLCDVDLQYGRLSSIKLSDISLPGFDAGSRVAMYGTSVNNEPEEIVLSLAAQPGTLGGAFLLEECTVALNGETPQKGFIPGEGGGLSFSKPFKLKVGQNTFVMNIKDANGVNAYTLLVMRANPPSPPTISIRTLPPEATPHPEELLKSLATVGNTGASGTANVYAGPSTDTGVVGKVAEGEEITLRLWSQDDAWCEIFFNEDSKLGWLSARYIVMWQN